MLRTMLIVVALFTSISSASAQEIDQSLLGLWAKERSFCQVLISQGDLKKLDRIFDYKYIYFERRIFYTNESTPYYVMDAVHRSNNSGSIRVSNEITNEIGHREYKIDNSRGALTIETGMGEMVFFRC